MPTATAPAPAAEPALLPHSFDELGRCLEPEIVPVAVPKGCTCELRLAQDAAGTWRIGYRLATTADDTFDALPTDAGTPHPSRAIALRCAAADARDWFEASPQSKLHKKCAGAVTAFLIALEGSPNKPAPAGARIPEAVNQDIEVAGTEDCPWNPPERSESAAVAELAQSIEAVGQLQPIGVRLIRDEQALPGVESWRRQLIWGSRRMAAHRRLKRATIPARVYKDITDDQARLLWMIENAQREDLNPIQEARGFADMMRDFDLTQDDIAKAVKKSRPVVANALRLLELPADVQEMLADGRLTTAHGTALCRFKKWPAACTAIARALFRAQLPSSAIEKELRDDAIMDALETEKAAVEIPHWEVNGRLPDKFKHDPDFIKNGYQWLCFAPEKWRTYKAERDAAAKEAEKKARAREATARETDQGEVIPKDQLWIADILPADKLGKKGGKLCCTQSRLWFNLVNEIRSYSRSADVKRCTQLANDAIEAVKKAKSLSSAWLAIIAADAVTDYSAGYNDDFGKACTALGLKPEGKEIDERAAALKEGDLLKVLVVLRLRSFAEDPDYCDLGDLGRILIRALGLEQIGFLEETPEGRAEIAAAMRKKFKWEAPPADPAEIKPLSKTPAKKAGKGGKKK